MDKKDLLFNVFGYKPQQPAPVQPPAPVPDPVKYKTRDSVSRESVTPETAANAQAMVWGNGMAPPPKTPPAKMVDKGQSPAMGNQEGWGKV